MEKSLRLERVGLSITVRCNLKCKLCNAYSPYYTRENHYSFQCLSKTIMRYFEVVDMVEKFTVAGGEPLLHPDLPEIIDYLMNYIEKIGVLEIITNGTIVPNNKLLNALSASNKIRVLIDDYGPELSQKIPYITVALGDAGVSYVVRKNYELEAHYNGWVDLSDLSNKYRTEEENEEIYHRCVYSTKLKCFPILDGKAYICATYKRCLDIGIIKDNPSEYINLFDDTVSIEAQRNLILEFFNRSYFSSCEYCNGFFEDSKRYPPAEQLR